MVYKLLETTQKPWKRVKGFNLLTLVVNNVGFKDSEQVLDQSDRMPLDLYTRFDNNSLANTALRGLKRLAFEAPLKCFG
jgi:hypothetical protein